MREYLGAGDDVGDLFGRHLAWCSSTYVCIRVLLVCGPRHPSLPELGEERDGEVFVFGGFIGLEQDCDAGG